MPWIFWIFTVAMTIAALLFVLRPVINARSRGVTLTLAIAVPAVAAGMYLAVGSPSHAGLAAHSNAVVPVAAAPSNAGKQVGSIASLVGGLEAKLAENPDDGKGWLLLAQSYAHLERTDDALDAYAHAVALGEYNASLDALANGAPADKSTTAAAALISGTVSLSSEAATRVQPNDVVFIFARGVDQAGAPAAVLQMRADSWPIEFQLSDANSMVAGNTLSNFQQVIVTARIARAGDATKSQLGLEAKSPPIAVGGNEQVNLVIQ